jgi:hypothetical protein
MMMMVVVVVMIIMGHECEWRTDSLEINRMEGKRI